MFAYHPCETPLVERSTGALEAHSLSVGGFRFQERNLASQRLRNHYLMTTLSLVTTYEGEYPDFRPRCDASTRFQVTNTEIGTPGASEMRVPPST